jgi:hypothetical protein
MVDTTFFFDPSFGCGGENVAEPFVVLQLVLGAAPAGAVASPIGSAIAPAIRTPANLRIPITSL